MMVCVTKIMRKCSILNNSNIEALKVTGTSNVINVEAATRVEEDIDANEEQNETDGDVMHTRISNLEASLHELTKNMTRLFQRQDQIIENETKLLKHQIR